MVKVTAGDGKHAQCGSNHPRLMWITPEFTNVSRCLGGRGHAHRSCYVFALTSEVPDPSTFARLIG